MGCEQNFVVLFQIYVPVLLLSNEISKGLRTFLLDGVTYLNYLTSTGLFLRSSHRLVSVISGKK